MTLEFDRMAVSLTDAHRRKLHLAMRQRPEGEVPVDAAGRIVAAARRMSAHFAMGLMVVPPTCGIDWQDIGQLAEPGIGTRAAQHSCGELRVTVDGQGLREIQFRQRSTDEFTALQPGQKLSDVSYGAFPDGLKSLERTWTFGGIGRATWQAPWRVDCLTREVGMQDQVVESQYPRLRSAIHDRDPRRAASHRQLVEQVAGRSARHDARQSGIRMERRSHRKTYRSAGH